MITMAERRLLKVHTAVANLLPIGSSMSAWENNLGAFNGKIVDKQPGDSDEETVLVIEGDQTIYQWPQGDGP